MSEFLANGDVLYADKRHRSVLSNVRLLLQSPYPDPSRVAKNSENVEVTLCANELIDLIRQLLNESNDASSISAANTLCKASLDVVT